MPRTIDFWFDYSCPYAYLASTQVEALATRTGAVLRWQPMLLGGVFRAVETPQNLMNALGPAKARHNAWDMHRWAELFGVPLNMPSGHPMRTVEALRATLAVGVDLRVVHGFYRAYWIDGRVLSDRETVHSVLSAAGHDADAVLERIDDPAIKTDLRERTDRAVARGIFGAPAFVGDDDALYWGQDRMHFVEGLSPEAYRARVVGPHRTATPAEAHTLEVYWDFSSPFAYLGCTQARALADRTGATLVWRPMLLGGLFKAIGQADVPLTTFSSSKQRYTMEDLHRWAAHWNVSFSYPTRFPMNTVRALRLFLALPESRRDAYRDAVFRAYWSQDRDIGDERILRDLAGGDATADEALARCGSPEVKQALFDATQRAVDAGVFGAPTWVVDGEQIFWGQDRLALVERALTPR